MTSLSISHLSVNLGDREIISDLSFDLREGEIASLLGPSGCGKTTLLRAIAGLIQPTSGTIRFGSQLVGVSSVVLPPNKRGTGYVPQQGALFPHLNVAKNISFGLDRELYSKKQISEITEEMINLIGLPGFENRLPSQLSGGQQQRVAIVRALAVEPEVLLLDEITSSLDPELVAEVLDVVRELKSSGMTIVLATHEMGFARDSSDVVCVLDNGRIVEQGPPSQVFGNPKSERVRSFLQRIIDSGRL